MKIEVTVRCINEYDNTPVYSCDVVYSSEGNVLVQSEVDDHTILKLLNLKENEKLKKFYQL